MHLKFFKNKCTKIIGKSERVSPIDRLMNACWLTMDHLHEKSFPSSPFSTNSKLDYLYYIAPMCPIPKWLDRQKDELHIDPRPFRGIDRVFLICDKCRIVCRYMWKDSKSKCLIGSWEAGISRENRLTIFAHLTADVHSLYCNLNKFGTKIIL